MVNISVEPDIRGVGHDVHSILLYQGPAVWSKRMVGHVRHYCCSSTIKLEARINRGALAPRFDS